MLKNNYSVSFFVIQLLVVLLICGSAAALDLPGGQSDTSKDIPVGQTEQEVLEGRTEGTELFGQGGYLHPFVFFEEKYTDNLYYTNTNEEEDFITSIAPGIWIAYPANREKLIEMTTSTTSPGGLKLSQIKPETTRRMQTYALYSPTFVYYKENPQHDHINHRLEGLFQYNFDSGISIDVIDQFNDKHEINNNAYGLFDEYEDNLLSFVATYKPSGKFEFRFDYSNYMLDFDSGDNSFRDREDNSFAGYVFYRFKPKTSLFAEYEYADIEYDINTGFNSEEYRYYGGLDWDVTAKTRGRVKLGYIEKEFESSALGTEETFAAELQAQHNFSDKRAMTLNIYRHFNESTLTDSYTIETWGIDTALLQRFSQKWSGTLSFLYYHDEYLGSYTYDDVTKERVDDTVSIGPTLIFEPKKWLEFELGYFYSWRDSNFDVFDFENNTIYINIALIM